MAAEYETIVTNEQGVTTKQTRHVTTVNPLPVVLMAADKSGNSSNNVSYQLLSNATATGAATTGVQGGSYVWAYTATTWNGATATLQVLGPDGATYQTVATATANGTQGVVIGSNATVRVAISAAVPTGVYSSIS